MSDSELAAVLTIVLSVILAVIGPLTVKLWRNKSPFFDEPATLERMGKPATARALRRLLPMSVLAWGLLTVAFGVGAIVPAAAEITAALILLAGVCTGLAVLVGLAAWPKGLVPPHLRHESGYFSDQRRSARLESDSREDV